MELLQVILQTPIAEYTRELKDTSNQLSEVIKIIYWMGGILILLIGYIWQYSSRRNEKTEDKVDRLAEQVTRLVAIMELVIPQTHENTEKINGIKENCASNKHIRPRNK